MVLFICLFLTLRIENQMSGPSWPWSYGSWIYNYLCYQYLSPLMLWVRISIKVRCTTLCDTVCQWFSPSPPVSSTNKTDRHDITEILLKVALNTIKQTNKQTSNVILHHKLNVSCFISSYGYERDLTLHARYLCF